MINWNENFSMQMVYGYIKFFYEVFLFIFEKFDFPVEIPPRKGGFVIFLHALPT